MEKTPLNKAHEAGRRATKLIRKGLFEEAAECHLEAARLLHDLQQGLSDDSAVLRSLDEQTKYHKRQAELAHIRRKALEKYTTRIRNMDTKVGSPSSSSRKLTQQTNNPQLAHHEILKNFDEADSLLQILSERKYNPAVKENKVHLSENVACYKPVFTIRPKNDADVIEELQMVNSNLRNLVDRLLGELHEVREENRSLKKRLETHETASSSSSIQSELEKASASSSLDAYKPRELPELAPLETPDFDFTGFS
ncbi:unnamed protein product [Orchesella dallaii]|uniref:Nuclear receptor-binding factor 2 MIT domain-containing protein n=1 Tax=Orchesella dallaii TaxID=48710 RepID=A0ABP1PYJ5_9HEXA